MMWPLPPPVTEKCRGFLLRGIYNFRGIPYGADTGGKNRFMPPQPPEPWEGILPAVWWGNSAPQNMDNRYGNAWASFVDHWNYDDVSEDCLRLNIWTPALDDGGLRPVMVWLHGGGYTNGNGIEQDGYMGENLSRKGNIVFVSINHRLGPIGFSDLSGVGGEKYASSGNAGALDMVAALEWVRDNISNFGGDPGNVTIMGQSGGGAKVCVLAAMPSARGLIHKAVPLSGSSTEGLNPEYSRKLGEYILSEAGLIFCRGRISFRKSPGRSISSWQARRSKKQRQNFPLPACGVALPPWPTASSCPKENSTATLPDSPRKCPCSSAPPSMSGEWHVPTLKSKR